MYTVHDVLFPNRGGAGELLPAEPGKPAQPKEGDLIAAKNKIQIVALGDSLTAGTGDLTGKGYVGRFKDKLAAQTGKPVYVLNNLAIPGYRTGQLLKDLDTKAVRDAIAQADIILLTIGGNDLNEAAGPASSNQTESFDFGNAEKNVPGTLERLDQIFTKIAQTNPKALVFYTALYYPYLDLDPDRAGPPIVQKFNQGAFNIANKFPNIVLVPTYDLFELSGTKYLYTDHFHPNGDGYERIADRIAQILK
jgi:lysophospholipase L1-like esterase